jgi:hypothetical protein
MASLQKGLIEVMGSGTGMGNGFGKAVFDRATIYS